jgi:hypothetical protein
VSTRPNFEIQSGQSKGGQKKDASNFELLLCRGTHNILVFVYSYSTVITIVAGFTLNLVYLSTIVLVIPYCSVTTGSYRTFRAVAASKKYLYL